MTQPRPPNNSTPKNLSLFVLAFLLSVVIVAIASCTNSDPETNAPSWDNQPTAGTTNAGDWPNSNALFERYSQCLTEKIDHERSKWKYAEDGTPYPSPFVEYFNEACAYPLKTWLRSDSVCWNDLYKCLGYSVLHPWLTLGVAARSD